ncbi:hypothetical protein [Streptomyces lincolnensis]|uniref:hypothetical protein n=1 Tax=Streptomyces lincolnensis TaxID=1915 RepID=UPI0037CE82D8
MPTLNRAIRAVRGRKTVTEPYADILTVISKWNTAVAEFDSVRDLVRVELSTLLPVEHERESRILLKQATSDHFMDAVLLSSPLSYEALCRAADDQRFRRTKDELTVYRFLQRFCAKNETGGSIGPVNLISLGYGARPSSETQFADDPTLGRIEYTAVGDGRSAERRTFLSYWAACEIGRALLRNTYERMPYRIYSRASPDLSEADARLLSLIDGRRSMRALASDLTMPVEAVDSSVSHLASLGLVGDDWRVPDFTTDPGQDLRHLAVQVGTPDAETARGLIDDVKRFAQTPLEDRPALLSTITRIFSQLTDKPAWRGAGQLRGDRAVLYEEATGNIRAARADAPGAQRLAERLATALELLASLAVENRAAGQSLLAQELARRDISELPAIEVRNMAAALPQTSLRERFLQRVDPSARCAEFSRQELVEAGLIRDDLDDWPVFGAADLMLTGPDGGDPTEPGSIILSELHHIWPTLGCWVRALWDDDTLGNEELYQLSARELAPAVPTLQEIVRHEKATDSSPYGHTVLCLDAGRPVPDAVTVPAERAVVRRWENGFIGLHDPVHRRDLALVPEYADSGVDLGGLINCAIPALHLSAFTLGPYTPRIVVDGVVVQRRRWEIAVEDVPGVGGRIRTEQEWLAVQIWRRGLDLPRRLYFMPDTEGKPVYLDFSSVLSVTNFLRCMRSAHRVVLTEALPDPERLWLRTKDGALTSEIRTLLWRNRRKDCTK